MMRFRRRQRIIPGVYLNFSQSGISTTIGAPGASVNFGRNGTYLNTGIPGTGLYNRQRIDATNHSNQNHNSNTSINQNSISSNQTNLLTSNTLINLQETIKECFCERIEIQKEIKSNNVSLVLYKILYFLSILLIVGFFIKWFKKNVNDIKTYITELNNQYENSVVNIDMNMEARIQNHFGLLLASYNKLLSCNKSWDITSFSSQDRRITRSSTDLSLSRTAITLNSQKINIIKSKFQPLYFKNANGGDLYFYPAFLFYFVNENNFALIDIREIKVSLINQQFLESENVPNDSTIINYTWAKSNADGSQDRRFKNNYQIPVCEYGRIDLTSQSGLNESYLFSNYQKTKDFAQQLFSFTQI